MKGRIKRETIPAKLTVIGKVKTGMKNDRGLPQSLDHFIFDSPYSDKLKQIYGDKPQSLEIIFPGDDFGDVCDERYELRTTKAFDGVGGRLFASGDGEEFKIYSKEADDYNVVTVPPDSKTDFMDHLAQEIKSEWKTTLTLRFILLKLTGVFGVFQYTTKGEASTIPQIVSVLDAVYEHAGRISGIPFDLQVDIAKSQRPGSPSKFPVVKLVPNLSSDMLKQIRQLESDRFTPLTVDRIHELAGTRPQLEDKTLGEKVAETFELPPELPKGDIRSAVETIDKAKDLNELNAASGMILRTNTWTKEEKQMLKESYDLKVGNSGWKNTTTTK